MLQAIRSTAGSWIAKILFILLIASFAVWGIGDFTRGLGRHVAEVGDVQITPQELDQEFRDEVTRLRRVMGADLTSEQARAFGLLERTLQQMVQRTLVSLAGQDKGLVPSDAMVADEIRRVPVFHNQLGQFDPDLMRALLRQNGMTEQGLVEQVRADMARGQLLGSVSIGAVLPTTLAETLFRFRNEKRVADLITVPASAMPEPAAPEASVLAQYHQDRAVRYTAPEYRGLTVAKLNAEAIADDITVSDADIEQAYNARASEFVAPERRAVVQAVLPDQAAAKAVADAVAGGTPLEQAAKAAGAEAIDLGEVTRDQLLPELVEPVFGLAQGASSAPVESTLGWHVLSVRSITPGHERPLAEVRDQVVADLRKERALDRLYEVANQMDDDLAGGATLEEAAQRAGAEIVRIEAVDNRGATPAGTPVEGVPALSQVLETAFALPAGDTGHMTETDAQGYFAVRVDGVQPAALKPLETIRDRVLADWISEQRAAAARAKADELAAKLREGADPAQLAATVPGAAHARSEPFTRRPEAAGALPGALVEELFGAQPGGVAVGDGREGPVVARLVEIIPAVPDAAGVRSIRETTEATLADDLVTQYVTGLQRQFPVSVNRGMIDSLYRPE
ncbi:peptidylprolyl isomerase [Rhodocista pekingensis]|uniref:Parvulin-like PPIase n=1 Tax=Rhodocista pekingensis TaxID=201185 RepID=A0ABW2KPY1_9PROT